MDLARENCISFLSPSMKSSRKRMVIFIGVCFLMCIVLSLGHKTGNEGDGTSGIAYHVLALVGQDM